MRPLWAAFSFVCHTLHEDTGPNQDIDFSLRVRNKRGPILHLTMDQYVESPDIRIAERKHYDRLRDFSNLLFPPVSWSRSKIGISGSEKDLQLEDYHGQTRRLGCELVKDIR